MTRREDTEWDRDRNWWPTLGQRHDWHGPARGYSLPLGPRPALTFRKLGGIPRESPVAHGVSAAHIKPARRARAPRSRVGTTAGPVGGRSRCPTGRKRGHSAGKQGAQRGRRQEGVSGLLLSPATASASAQRPRSERQSLCEAQQRQGLGPLPAVPRLLHEQRWDRRAQPRWPWRCGSW